VASAVRSVENGTISRPREAKLANAAGGLLGSFAGATNVIWQGGPGRLWRY